MRLKSQVDVGVICYLESSLSVCNDQCATLLKCAGKR